MVLWVGVREKAGGAFCNFKTTDCFGVAGGAVLCPSQKRDSSHALQVWRSPRVLCQPLSASLLSIPNARMEQVMWGDT